MKKVFIVASAITLIIATGCGGKNEKTESTATPAATTTTSATPAQVQPGPAGTNVQPSTPSFNVQPNASSQPTTVAAGMNPAHGQPGHRCEIAVGAPLNSAPAKPSVTQSPVNVNTAPVLNTAPVVNSQPVTTTAAGMNPAHGQPGHRCDISVGAPLNSPASTTPVKKQ